MEYMKYVAIIIVDKTNKQICFIFLAMFVKIS